MNSVDGVDFEKFWIFLRVLYFIAAVKVTFALRIRETWVPPPLDVEVLSFALNVVLNPFTA